MFSENLNPNSNKVSSSIQGFKTVNFTDLFGKEVLSRQFLNASEILQLIKETGIAKDMVFLQVF